MLRLSALLSISLLTASALAQKTPITITADLRETPRKLYHAEVDIPVTPGPVTLLTPQWIPGTHSPGGPVADITGLVFTANGKPLAWRRDDLNLFSYHMTIPAGATSVHAHIDVIAARRNTTKMAVLEWQSMLMYPAGTPVRDIPIQPSVIVPEGWGIGTSLTPTSPYDPDHPTGGTVHYAPTTVEMLEDSPIMAGAYFKEYALAPDVTPKHYIDCFGDAPEDVILRPSLLAELNNLVHETGAMYSSRHYNTYHFLLTLSAEAGGGGLEHHQSSDNGVPEHGFADDNNQLLNSDLLSHEFTHSWNGKYRRPDGLATPDYATPMKGELLWVYEGLTQYLGNVLAARSGLKNQQHYREALAYSAASLDYKPGRLWRSTDDTAIAASTIRGGSQAWVNWRRSQDYYQEGELLWLDADATIRKLTNDQKNLHDFLVLFLAKGGNTPPMVVPYDRAELITELNQVVRYDWAGFLHDRIDNLNPHADLIGIEQGGYKLVYTDKPSSYEHALLTVRGTGLDVWFSLGLRLTRDGTISDVLWDGPSDKAKLAPDQKILAVDGKIFSNEAVLAALRKAKSSTEPIHLIIQSDKDVFLADIDYHQGERYPTLQRTDSTTDYLDENTKSLTTPEKAPEEKKTSAN